MTHFRKSRLATPCVGASGMDGWLELVSQFIDGEVNLAFSALYNGTLIFGGAIYYDNHFQFLFAPR